MRRLERPILEKSAREIFELCVKGYSELSRINRLLLNSDRVEQDSKYYDEVFCVNFLCEIFDFPSGNEVTRTELKNLYDQKFAQKGSPGRLYYDKLMAAPTGGICPICGIRAVNNLDHYLPKAAFPTLAVSPSNLVPLCRDCNKEKSDFVYDEPKHALIHPYFDEVDIGVWLKASLKEDKTAYFTVNCPEHWDRTIITRIQTTFDLYKLNQFYSIKAAQEISDDICYWRQIFRLSNGVSQLWDYFSDRLKSIEVNSNNSWKAALYRGLLSDFILVQKWLTPTPRTVDPTTTSTDV